MLVSMLTTTDNPHNPFEDFKAWYAYDTAAGYHTTELLGRLMVVSHDLPETEYHSAVEEAIDEIVEENVLGIFMKVQKNFDN